MRVSHHRKWKSDPVETMPWKKADEHKKTLFFVSNTKVNSLLSFLKQLSGE